MSNAPHCSLDTAAPRAAEGTGSPAYPLLVIAATILASSQVIIDSSIVNVGLPAISRSFHADAIGLQWDVNAYLLALSALLLLGGAAGDRIGGVAVAS
jgi:MFS family permease